MSNFKEITNLETALAEIDYLYQEGCIFTKEEVRRIKVVSSILKQITEDLPKFNQVKED